MYVVIGACSTDGSNVGHPHLLVAVQSLSKPENNFVVSRKTRTPNHVAVEARQQSASPKMLCKLCVQVESVRLCTVIMEDTKTSAKQDVAAFVSLFFFCIFLN